VRKEYDVVVLGSGVAGGVAARNLRGAGLSVAIAEPGPLGGTCPLRGCEPKKVLYDVIETLSRTRRHQGKGLRGEPELDWTDLVAFKNGFVDPVPEKSHQDLIGRGIDVTRGAARFLDPRTIEVNSARMTAEYVILCTGAGPRPLKIPGAEHIAESRRFFDLKEPPARMVVIGGGYIAFEFAHMAARAGVGVDIVVRSGRCLKHFDPDLVDMLVEKSMELGIGIHLNAPTERIEKGHNGLRVLAGDGAVDIEADLVLHGAGRIPAVEGLDLESGEVEVREGKLQLNEYLQSTSNPSVYAAGDVNSRGPQLTPVALMEAESVVENILKGNRKTPDYSAVPSVLFSHPVLARVGMLEEECRAQGILHEKRVKETSNWASVRRLGEETAGAKILLGSEDDRILGAHLLGPRVEEVINVFSLAMKLSIKRRDIMQTIWSYPSFIYDTVRFVLR